MNGKPHILVELVGIHSQCVHIQYYFFITRVTSWNHMAYSAKVLWWPADWERRLVVLSRWCAACQGYWTKAQLTLAGQSLKAEFALWKYVHHFYDPPTSLTLLWDLFDKFILPILSYSCEVWGFGQCCPLGTSTLPFASIFSNDSGPLVLLLCMVVLSFCWISHTKPGSSNTATFGHWQVQLNSSWNLPVFMS